MPRIGATAAVIAIVCAAHVCDADDASARARSLFEEGTQLAKENRWGEAVRKFEASRALRPHAKTTYNLGFCERALGHPTRARKYLNRALDEDREHDSLELGAEVRETIAGYLEETNEQIATPHLAIAPKSARVSVDGAPLEWLGKSHALAGTLPPGPGTPPPEASFTLEIDAGAHEILVVTDDGRSRIVHEYFPPRSSKQLVIEVPPAPPVVAIAPSDTMATRRTIGWLFAGAGVAMIGAGGYFALSARATYADANDACPNRARCPDERGAALASEARVDANLATAAFVVGAAALTCGVVIVATSKTKPSTSVTVGAGTFSLVTSF